MTNQNQTSPAPHPQSQTLDSGSVHVSQRQQLWLSLHRSHRRTASRVLCISGFLGICEAKRRERRRPNCSKSLRGRRSAKEPETSPVERVLKITPVCKEPPAARELGPRDHRVTVLICTDLPKSRKKDPARSLRHQEKCEYCTSNTTGRRTDRERSKEGASVVEGTGRRSATSAQPGNPGEPGLREVVADFRSCKHEEVTLRFSCFQRNDGQRARFRKDL